ncbi:MAG TPA: NrfD/PsrC family molybdoenzyme membrane anchor subunit [Thermodesulfobacteriota bacterium]|nr:NrfD/PsrC family molybdoenzyme membrane anchor subunit [Thermodesulfobacteriota bacterium]
MRGRNRKLVYQSQREWSWTIATEIFCGGTAGGVYIISVLPYLLFGGRIFLKGVFASLVLLLVSILLLIIDVNSIRRVPRTFINTKSPLTLGAISLSLFIIFLILTIGILYTGIAPLALYAVVCLGITVSVLTIVYPGILMGLMKAIPIWSGSGPSLLLLSASLASGSAVATLVGGMDYVDSNLSRIPLWLLVIYGLFLSIYIILGSQGSRAAQISIQQLFKGNLSPIFIIGVIAVGLIAPFVLFIIGIISFSASMSQVGSVLILIGGILMRYSLIASGVKTSVLSDDSITAIYWLDHRG